MLSRADARAPLQGRPQTVSQAFVMERQAPLTCAEHLLSLLLELHFRDLRQWIRPYLKPAEGRELGT